jgi:hypothetical protein
MPIQYTCQAFLGIIFYSPRKKISTCSVKNVIFLQVFQKLPNTRPKHALHVSFQSSQRNKASIPGIQCIKLFRPIPAMQLQTIPTTVCNVLAITAMQYTNHSKYAIYQPFQLCNVQTIPAMQCTSHPAIRCTYHTVQ